MKPSASHFHNIGGLRYHVRTWGDPARPKLFLLHGWMDLSASFQFLVDAFERDWYVLAPDWRGFGLSQWNTGVYWFPEYVADLDALLRHYSPDTPVDVVGHSMGGNVACLYAGVRPERVRRLVSIEGIGIPNTTATQAPERVRRWLNEIATPPSFRSYRNFDELVERLTRENPRLTTDKAVFLAHHWAHESGAGDVVLRGDPKHKIVNPVLYRVEEAIATWERITAPVLWLQGRVSEFEKWIGDAPEQYTRRKAAFQHLTERIIEGAGHMVHLDNPAAAAQAIEEFLT